MNKHIIFDNYDPDDYREGAIESLLENCNYSAAADIPESEIYNDFSSMENLNHTVSYIESQLAKAENELDKEDK